MNHETTWNLYSSNEEAWAAMLADCAQAKESIVLEQYIFVADDFGKKLMDVCAERAAQGVKVRFLWDAAGSFTLWGSNIAEDLKKKGIELIFWKTLIPDYSKIPNFRAWFFRNHRRTLVIDDRIGYTGSMCVYEPMKSWRDTNLRLEGSVVQEMKNAFDRMWARAKHSQVMPERIHVRNHEFRYITNYPAPRRRHIYTELIEAVRSARKYIYITNPYFVPTRRLVRIFRLAARRGVDVRIIIPENSNYYAVDLGARSYFNTLLSSGVRIFLYSGNMIHAKTAVIDGEWATVGTMNLDRVSLLYNFEANIISRNGRFAEELVALFVRDIQDSKEVLYPEWKNRFFVEKIPEKLITLVRKFL
ncbi:MAG TPA: phospholipase D-like domain-containing protein [Candidatus Paceibacterota bacterium]|jgi:cardiolipin synthase|nr:phospholipase D-like domain-containing protein [Candidatus Paceibacterota bacterium]